MAEENILMIKHGYGDPGNKLEYCELGYSDTYKALFIGTESNNSLQLTPTGGFYTNGNAGVLYRETIDGGINTGILPITFGGTGRGSLTSGSYLRGNGTGAVELVTPYDVCEDIGAMRCVSDSSNYKGMATDDDDDKQYIRTTERGIIPYISGGSSNLGTSVWPFNSIVGNIVYGKEGFTSGTMDNAGSLGKLHVLPSVTYSILGSPSGNAESFFKELIKWVCKNYAGYDNNSIFIIPTSPGTRSVTILCIYNTSNIDSTTGLPQHSFGFATSYNTVYYSFGTTSYNYYYNTNLGLNLSNLNGVLPVSKGGTGVSDLYKIYKIFHSVSYLVKKEDQTISSNNPTLITFSDAVIADDNGLTTASASNSSVTASASGGHEISGHILVKGASDTTVTVCLSENSGSTYILKFQYRLGSSQQASIIIPPTMVYGTSSIKLYLQNANGCTVLGNTASTGTEYSSRLQIRCVRPTF